MNFPIVNVEKKTVTVKEGESTTLNCEIDSNPAVAYHNWMKGGAVVSTDLNYVIGEVQRSDAGFYRCIASSEFYDGTQGMGYNETEVIVEYIPDVSVEKADWMRKEGEQVTFTCTVDSNPEVTFHNWTKDGAVVSTDLSHAIANVQRQNAGTYQCIAGNVFYDGTTGTGSSATELTVQYFPDVEVDKKTVTVKEGEDAALNCEIDSKPEVTYHNWTYMYGGAVLSTNLSLVIENVQRHNAGIYVCIAGNVFYDGSPGTGYNETELIVEYSPEVKVERTTLMVKEGENITLSCEIDSHPEAAYHNWTKGGVVVSSDLSHVINVVQRSDAGVYMCIAGTEFYDGTVGTGYNTTELNVQYIPDVMVDKKTVTVKEGDNVTFYCNIDSDPEVTYHNWTRGGVVVSTELSYRIQNVQRQDGGEYTCIAGTTFYDGTVGTGYDKTELYVQYIPEIMVDKQIVTVKEGENITLNCEIDSNPVVAYHNWTKDGAVVSTDLSHMVNNVQRSDAGAYVCMAGVDFYDGTSATANGETMVNVEYFPDVRVEKATLTVKEGETATFICSIDSNPEVTYHNWTNGGVVLSTHLSHTIEKTKRLDSGVYTCVAGNVLYDGTLGTGYSETELDVEYIPEVTIDNRNTTIKEGESATFNCNVVSNPEVSYHNWSKDGAVISTDLSHSVSNATRHDAGLYTCIAGNVFHDGSMGVAYDTAELTIQYGPDVKINGSIIVVTEGESAFLDCVIDANPLAESYNWTKGDILVSSNLTHFIERTNRDDAGVYECRASNTLYDGTMATGNDTVLLVVEYPPVVRIEGPSGPVAENNKITIRCIVEDGIPDPYKISLYLSNVTGDFEVDWTEDHRGVTSHAFDIVDIKRWSAGSYYCVAWASFNDSKDYDGRSDKIDITVNYKDDPAANVTVIIVIVVGILILIIIFVAIIRKTNKRRKREKYRLKQSASGINGSGETKDELDMDKLEMDRTPPDGNMTQENIYQ
ncbi:hemicentin-1-like [Ptychodera flava]|uniref:hemicentin-1-like n=1 Tax=Ptychodera flava TaxID=63121 RepID=UPI00396A7400